MMNTRKRRTNPHCCSTSPIQCGMLHAFRRVVMRHCVPPKMLPQRGKISCLCPALPVEDLKTLVYTSLRLLQVHSLEHFVAGKHYGTRRRCPDYSRPYACEQCPAAALPLYLPQGLQDSRRLALCHLRHVPQSVCLPT